MSAHRNEQEKSRDHAKVLSIAARMFLEKGYEAASVRQIAAAAGPLDIELRYLVYSMAF